MQIDSISYNLSYIYIYIFCQDLSQNFSEMTGNKVKRGRLTEKQRETHGFTPFSLCFAPFSLDFTAKHSNFKRFHTVTEENRAFQHRFHRIRRRFCRVRSRFSCLFSGREKSQKRAVWKRQKKESQNHPRPLWGDTATWE